MPYKWIALSNTTLGILLATVNQSIVIISLPAIFRGIGLNPLAPGNTSYLLWMLMGYLLVSAVLVVTLGRLGDMLGRVKIYNFGFVVFTVASILLSIVPFSGGAGALWLIGWRIVQGIGGAMLMANSTAILTDAFPPSERGMALGINQVAALAGSFIGLVAGGLLSEWEWRSVFLVSVPLGVLGTLWAYRSLHEVVVRRVVKIDWWGNVTFAVGLTAVLAAITYGIQPYGGHTEGWTNPWVLTGLFGGLALLGLFVLIESRVASPMFSLGLFRIRAFATGNVATLLASIARGGMQFMLIIWLQGIWLPLHGYTFEQTPLWAGIYLLPLTVGFLTAGPLAGRLSDKHGARVLSTAGLLLAAATFLGLLLLPIDFSYWQFAVLIALNGAGSGLFAAPNTASVMSSVPASERGAAAGMGSTFMTAGTVLSIGVFFSLLIAGLAQSLPATLGSGLQAAGVPASAAQQAAALPPVGSVFAAFLGFNPVEALLGPQVIGRLDPAQAADVTGQEFFPRLISDPVHQGLVVVFLAAAGLCVLAAVASALRGKRYLHADNEAPGVVDDAAVGETPVPPLASADTADTADTADSADSADSSPGAAGSPAGAWVSGRLAP
jgi:MFS family permease